MHHAANNPTSRRPNFSHSETEEKRPRGAYALRFLFSHAGCKSETRMKPDVKRVKLADRRLFSKSLFNSCLFVASGRKTP